MRKLKFFLVALAVILTISKTFAQTLPNHDFYIDYGLQDREKLVDAIINWSPGDNLSEDPDYVDENFFISRVRLKKKFDNENQRANSNANTERKMNWWMPIGEQTKKWQALPRYNFQGDNFNMWQYVDIHGNWSSAWFRVPASFSDVAHKNGVTTGCLYFIDWAASVTEHSAAGKMLARLSETDESGKYKNARKLIQFLKYYGIEGIGVNPEGYWSQTLVDKFSGFLAECHRMGEEENWPFRVDWYSMVSNTGQLSRCGYTLSERNDKWFQQDGTPVTDVFFLDYGWQYSGLKTACEYAESLGRSPYDIYCGFLQGQEGSTYQWKYLTQYDKGSICMWGGHGVSNLFNSSNEISSSDEGVETEYQTKQEMLFTNGKRNVLANLPVPSSL
jgi:endo-beta-N-acetylglucosaminidase D